jgi:hypothetical protein
VLRACHRGFEYRIIEILPRVRMTLLKMFVLEHIVWDAFSMLGYTVNYKVGIIGELF